MPNKPTHKPTWAQSAPDGSLPGQTARRVWPPVNTNLEQQGWSFGQKPPHEYMNGWMHNVAAWVSYLDQLGAGDIPTAASGSVQQALDGINATNQSQQAAISGLVAAVTAMPQADSVGLRELKKPQANTALPDLWSSITGRVVHAGRVFPSQSNPAGDALGQATWGAGGPQTMDEWGWGTEFVVDSLRIANAMTFQNLYGPFVLRCHGDLVLDAPLRINAGPGGAADTIELGDVWQRLPYSCEGGCGVWGQSDTKHKLYGPSPFYDQNNFRRHILGARSVAGVEALLPWLRGGGASGGAGCFKKSEWSASANQYQWVDKPGAVIAPAGGVAVILVSGDVVVGPGGAISCSGADGVLTPADPGSSFNSPFMGAGGGGGGALFVFCGGQVRAAPGTTLPGAIFTASGGRGTNLSTSGWIGTPTRRPRAGGGGGGGLVYLCGRNMSAGFAAASAGVGGLGSGSGPVISGLVVTQQPTQSGTAGQGGAVRVSQAIPQILL